MPLPEAAPAQAANRRRNARAAVGRARRWAPARDALWALLDAHVARGAAVAIVGAGHGDDLPLGRLSRRAGRVDLLDVDVAAARAARRRLLGRRGRVRALESDITAGAADRVAAAVIAGRPAPVLTTAVTTVGRGRYDVIIADLLYTQLLFPALLDAGLPGPVVGAALNERGTQLTRLAVQRLHASAPQGTVVHLHDLLAWWPGHSQPYTLDALVALAGRDQAAALRLVDGGRAPRGADPRPALRALGAEIQQTALWRWPFSPDVDYLVCAFVARQPARCQPGTTPVTGAASSATGSGVKRYPTPKWVCT